MRVRVKICGITDTAAIDAAVSSGADALGFVFSESPRRVTPLQAAKLLERVPAHIVRVAVLRRPGVRELSEALDACVFDCVQTEAECAAAVTAVTKTPLLPVFHDGPGLENEVGNYRVILVDGPVSGSGVRVDWDRVSVISKTRRVVLAGGLTPENVGEAIRRIRPFGVDVSSGVESAPGRKDPSRITAFLESVRAAEHQVLMEEQR